MKKATMVRCSCQVCRCDKKVSSRRGEPCAYCTNDTHRVTVK